MKKNPLKTYSFWFKIIGAALLIAFGLWIVFDEKMAVFMVLMLTGLVAGLFGIIRFIPLMKTLKNGKSKAVHTGEIIIHVGIAALLIYGAINKINPDKELSALANFVINNYRFIIAFFFVSRVIAYFWCTVIFEEKTDKTKFWVHILLIVLACVMCSLANVKPHAIAIVIAIIALICATGLITEGATGYGRYRKSLDKPEETKKEKNNKKSKDVPTEEIIIPVDDEQNDSAIVN